MWLLIAGVHLLLGVLAVGLAIRRKTAVKAAEPASPSALAQDALVRQALAQALERQPERVLPVLLALDPLLAAARRRPKSSLAVAAVVGLVLGLQGGRR